MINRFEVDLKFDVSNAQTEIADIERPIEDPGKHL